MCVSTTTPSEFPGSCGLLEFGADGNAKLAFRNVEKGNGFDAWRRVAVPIMPRSEARLHAMRNEVPSPPASRKLTDVMTELDNWEAQLREYYECGGDVIPARRRW